MARIPVPGIQGPNALYRLIVKMKSTVQLELYGGTVPVFRPDTRRMIEP